MPSTLYLGNSMILRLEGLRDRDGALVLAADVELTELVDGDGDDVVGVTLPLDLTPLGDGNYEGQIPPITDLEPGVNIYATVVATAAGTVGQFTERCMVRTRSA